MPSKTPLRAHLDATQQTAETFATAHDLSPWSVRHWARGDKCPELENQIKLGEATGGSAGPDAWLNWTLENPRAAKSDSTDTTSAAAVKAA